MTTNTTPGSGPDGEDDVPRRGTHCPFHKAGSLGSLCDRAAFTPDHLVTELRLAANALEGVIFRGQPLRSAAKGIELRHALRQALRMSSLGLPFHPGSDTTAATELKRLVACAAVIGGDREWRQHRLAIHALARWIKERDDSTADKRAAEDLLEYALGKLVELKAQALGWIDEDGCITAQWGRLPKGGAA